MEASVEHAIHTMWARYDEPLSLETLAAEVFVSPFHFCRVFARATGLTPGRYLTAIRLFESKRLLVTTRGTVSDIVCRVGYSSVGTFTTRFVQRVGMTPSQYREPPVSDLAVAISPSFFHLPDETGLCGHAVPRVGPGERTVRVRVDVPPGEAPSSVFVGAFDEPFPHRSPVAHHLTTSEGGRCQVDLTGVPDGAWTVIAAVRRGEADAPIVGAANVDVRSGIPALAHVTPAPVRPTTPPIAVTLGDPRSALLAAEAVRPESAARHLRVAA